MKKQHSKLWEYVPGAIFLVLITAICLLDYSIRASYPDPSPQQSTAAPTQVRETQWQPPESTPYQNGRIIKYPDSELCAPLKINTSGNGYYFFVLSKPGTSKRYMTFFGWAGDTVEVDVPLGTYELYYAQGDTWYGTIYLFGNQTLYGKCDSRLSFTEDADGYSGYEITLYPVYGGNMDTSTVSAAEFPV